MRYGAVLGLVLACVGCRASGPRFVDADIPQPKARLYVYRPTSVVNGLSSVDLVLDGRPLASLDNAGYVTVLLSPGRHFLVGDLSFAMPTFARSVDASSTSEVFQIEPGEAIYCRYQTTTVHMRATWHFECSNDAEAHGVVRRCKLQPLDPDTAWEP